MNLPWGPFVPGSDTPGGYQTSLGAINWSVNKERTLTKCYLSLISQEREVIYAEGESRDYGCLSRPHVYYDCARQRYSHRLHPLPLTHQPIVIQRRLHAAGPG